jgi:hypothetical protein
MNHFSRAGIVFFFELLDSESRFDTLEPMIKILMALSFLFYSFLTQAYENKYFSQQDPLGWIQQPLNDVNYLFLASVASKEKLPVLISMTYDKKINPNDAGLFLKNTLLKGFKKVKKLKLNQSRFLKLKSPYVFYEISYLEEGASFKGYALLIPQKNRYHFFQFTTGVINFDVFSKDVLAVFNSTQLK